MAPGHPLSFFILDGISISPTKSSAFSGESEDSPEVSFLLAV